MFIQGFDVTLSYQIDPCSTLDKAGAAAAAAAGVATGDGTAPAEDEASGPKKRSGKTQLFIDFVDAPEVDEDELFAPAESASLMFTAANEAENRKSKHVLPDDIHFSSKQLLRMFLKPSYIVSWAWRGMHHTHCRSIVPFFLALNNS